MTVRVWVDGCWDDIECDSWDVSLVGLFFYDGEECVCAYRDWKKLEVLGE